jgi:hypothetical protein
MFRNATAALMLVLGFAAAPVAAAEPAPAPVANSVADTLAADTDWSLPAAKLGSVSNVESRGALLPGLYVSLAALNAYDAYSTHKGLAAGAVEQNAAMQAVVGHSSSLIAVKAAVTVGTVVVAERLWKSHHKGQAIAMMVISNGIMSAVALHNNSVLNTVGR